jgi:uncharacterized protein YbaP (TraB family)
MVDSGLADLRAEIPYRMGQADPMKLGRFLPPFSALALLCLALAGHAGEPQTAQKHFLWKVTGGSGVAFLFGTVHVGKNDLYPLASVIEDSFKQSDTLIEEVDPATSLESLRLAQDIIKGGMYPADDSIANHLSEVTRARLTDYAKSGQLGADYTRAKPWLLSLMIIQHQLKEMGFDQSKGLDQHFMKEATDMHKAIGALETADSQLRLFSSFPDDLQDQLLLTTLLDAAEATDILDRTLKAWSSGNTEAMDGLINRDVRDHPVLQPLMEKMFYERNDAMTQQIEKFLQTGKTYFVAVGAGHLVGERGIVKQLRRKNYTVEQP